MRRTIIIGSCLTALCITVLVSWMYVKRTGQGDVSVAEENIHNGQASNPIPGSPIENNAMDRSVFKLPVDLAYFDDQVTLSDNDTYSPCYVDREKKTLYRWKDVVLQRDQLPKGYTGVISSMPILIAKKFTVVPVAALMKYREVDGEYRPGYLDKSNCVFYEWKGIVLSKQEALDKSQDGQDAIVELNSEYVPRVPINQVVEIPIPAHLKDQPQLWKKGGAYTLEARIRAEKKAAEKKAAEKKAAEAEKRAAEKRAQEPRVFTLLVRITFFGENDFSPCYYDPQNRTLYRWRGVVLRWEQAPEAYRKQKVVTLTPMGLSVVPVEAPVNYREVNGKYRPGYLDRSIGVFYEWKDVVLNKQELLDKSKDGQDAVVKPAASGEVIEIDMPAHLKDHPGFWKKN